MLELKQEPESSLHACGAVLDVQRGPEGLFVRLKRPAAAGAAPGLLAEQLWDLLRQHFASRLVLDLSQIDRVDRQLVEQLFLLSRRLHDCHGMLRLCGLSPYNRELLRRCERSDELPFYSDQREAIFAGRRPTQPR